MKLGTNLLDDVEAHDKNTLDIAAAAAKITVPWLILHGKKDETVPVDEAERLHELAPSRSTLRLIEADHGFGAKHPFSEVPASFSNALRETIQFFEQNLN